MTLIEILKKKIPTDIAILWIVFGMMIGAIISIAWVGIPSNYAISKTRVQAYNYVDEYCNNGLNPGFHQPMLDQIENLTFENVIKEQEFWNKNE